MEGRTGTLHVCWQWSLIAEWTGAVKRATVRRLLPLCSNIREPSVRWVEPTYLLWQAEHSYWYTTDDRDTRGREPLNLKREPIVKLLTKIILKSKLGKYFKNNLESSPFILTDLCPNYKRENKLVSLLFCTSLLRKNLLSKNFLICVSKICLG